MYRHASGLRGQIVEGPRETSDFKEWGVRWDDGKFAWVPENELQAAPPPLGLGSAVVSWYDPGLHGQIVDGPRESSGNKKWRVRWNDGKFAWESENELQAAPPVPPDARKLLSEGTFCDHSHLKRIVIFCQITGKLSNLVYSMDATNTDFYPYQYKPLLTFLESPSNGILIADEVGLGKTIEAGLIWTELRARYDARRLLVVCPAMLCDKWISELQYRFGVDARKLDAKELLHELDKSPRYRVPPQAFVCSIQGLRPPKGFRDPTNARHQSPRAKLARLLEDRLGDGPIFDLLIVDEAHYLRNPATQSSQLGILLRDVSEHVVLLSATPINNKNEDLFQLLHLLDPDMFFSSRVFPEILEANSPLVRAHRLAFSVESSAEDIIAELRDAASHILLHNSKALKDILRTVNPDYLKDRANRVRLAHRIARVNLLGYVVSRTRKREVQELRVVRKPLSYKVDMESGGVEEQFYHRVTRAIRSYAHAKGGEAGFLLSLPQQMMSSSMYAAAQSWSGRYPPSDFNLIAYETMGEEPDQPDGRSAAKAEEIQPLVAHIAKEALAGFDWKALRHADSKFDAFYNWLRSFLNSKPDDKIIVFSYFKATLHYLSTRLQDKNVTTQVLHGDVKENKQEAINRFKESASDRVLLTSEVASEGVDLQFSWCIVNYDLPWNPMRIEQRIGRVDRIGQASPTVWIVNFMYANTVDERIYTRLLEKLGIFERALGGMEEILGKEVSKLAAELMTSDLTPEDQEQRISEVAASFETQRAMEELEEKRIHLMAHEDRILENVKKAYRLKRRIASSDLKNHVGNYLQPKSGSVFRESLRDPRIVNIKLPDDLCAQLSAYMRKEQVATGTRLTEGQVAPYVFSRKIAEVGHRMERITQFHPLIRFIGSEQEGAAAEFCPLVAVRLAVEFGDRLASGLYVFVLQRWHFRGSREVEELRARAMLLHDGRELDGDQSLDLVNAAKEHGTDWPAARAKTPVGDALTAIDKMGDRLQGDYENMRRERQNANNDRVDVQVASLNAQSRRQSKSQERLLERYRRQRNDSLVAMTEGRLRKIRARCETQVADREQKRQLYSRREDLCAGVILVVTGP